jgi:hypothetical protein
MQDYKNIKTSLEVIQALRLAHGNELVLFGSYTKLGESEGDSNEAYTKMGFNDSPVPLYEIRQYWTTGNPSHNRVDELTDCFLCYPTND